MGKGLRTVSLVLALLTQLAATAFAEPITGPANVEKLRQDTLQAVRSRLAPLLTQYCKEACEIVDVKVDVDEQLTESDDLGFEGVTGDDPGARLQVSKVTAWVQVDDRVTTANRDRLMTILKNNLQTLGTVVDVVWEPVTLPQIGQSEAKEEQLKRSVEQRVAAALERVIETYCPEECVLSQVAVDGRLVTADEAADVPVEQLVHDKAGSAILRLEAVDAEVSLDEGLPQETRAKIANVMKARTRFAQPFHLEVQVAEFPESFAKKQEREQRKSEDPFGLEKLRQTLRIFRELAGTKEIVTHTTSREQSSVNARESTSNASTTSSQSAERSATAAAGPAEKTTEPWQWVLYAAGLILLLGTIAGVLMRLSSASRDARLMMLEAGAGAGGGRAAAAGGFAASGAGAGAGDARPGGLSDTQRRDMTLRWKIQELRDDLIKVFVDQPRVAKETFSRLLQEEGVEETARYVHIFGHLVIFELLGDPNLQRDLYELSEYYHKSDFDFPPEEEIRHLTALKTRVTANEIRVLTRKQMDKFDFLAKLDATQIHNLIGDEKPQVQSIVLTQLDHKRRRAVFDMYAGQSKVELMRELCRADAYPKEFLSNVAKALLKKVQGRPEFDTENLRSSDILLDLLEKAELSEQRGLMQNLVQTNPEAARAIKLKLVTVEIMPYLKDGHLLEIILGMERDDLVLFLAGTREHIRNLILAKAPEELAESWLEDLGNRRGGSDQDYRLVEMKVLGRIRNLANNGVINLLDVNDMIFGRVAEGQTGGETARGEIPPLASGLVA